MAEPSRFLQFTRRLEALEARYMVTGSVAVIAYSAPRFTHDIDLVVALDRGKIARLPKVFPETEFYVPPIEAIIVEAARDQRGHLNLIHHETGFKADIYLAGRNPLHAWALARTRRLDLGGETLVVAPPEYVIVRKLQFYREGGSESTSPTSAPYWTCRRTRSTVARSSGSSGSAGCARNGGEWHKAADRRASDMITPGLATPIPRGRAQATSWCCARRPHPSRGRAPRDRRCRAAPYRASISRSSPISTR